jgi:hypothetical protein
MEKQTERNLGPQPLETILTELELKSHDLVVASKESLTHKMVARGCKGRRLTKNVQLKVRNALNLAAGKTYRIGDLFNYS